VGSTREHADTPQPRDPQAAEEAERRGRLTELRERLYGAATQKMLDAAHSSRATGYWTLPPAPGTRAGGRHAGWEPEAVC
jgi:hypothetical protein